MNSQVIGLRVAGTLFGLFAAAHLARWWTATPVVIGKLEISSMASIVGALVAALLSFWMWSLSSRKR